MFKLIFLIRNVFGIDLDWINLADVIASLVDKHFYRKYTSIDVDLLSIWRIRDKRSCKLLPKQTCLSQLTEMSTKLTTIDIRTKWKSHEKRDNENIIHGKSKMWRKGTASDRINAQHFEIYSIEMQSTNNYLHSNSNDKLLFSSFYHKTLTSFRKLLSFISN